MNVHHPPPLDWKVEGRLDLICTAGCIAAILHPRGGEKGGGAERGESTCYKATAHDSFNESELAAFIAHIESQRHIML